MVRTSNVVEDARDTGRPQPSRQVFGWLGAGLLVGAGITVLLLGSDSPAEPAVTTIAVDDTRPAEAVGVGSIIPGFPDGLVATIRQEGLSLALALWPESGELVVKSVPVGSSSPPRLVEFDVGGHQLATIVPVQGSAAGVLYAGVPESASIISTDVTSYAWHDSLTRTLAYTTQSDAETLVWVATGGLSESEVAASAVGIDGGLEAWGDWGFALQDGPDVVLFTPEGEIKDLSPGRVFDSASEGWLAVDNGGMELLTAGGGVRELARIGIRSPLDAAFSPDGSRLAVLSADGMTVAAVEDGSQLAVAEGRPGVATVTWTRDGEFALYPGLRGITVLRVSDGAVWQLMESDVVTGLGILDFDDQP